MKKATPTRQENPMSTAIESVMNILPLDADGYKKFYLNAVEKLSGFAPDSLCAKNTKRNPPEKE